MIVALIAERKAGSIDSRHTGRAALARAPRRRPPRNSSGRRAEIRPRADIGQRQDRADRFAQNGQIFLGVKTMGDVFVAIERGDVADRDVPQHAMNAHAAVRRDADKA